MKNKYFSFLKKQYIGILLAAFFSLIISGMAYAETEAPDWSDDEGYTHQSWEFHALNIDELNCPPQEGDPAPIPQGIPGRDIDFLEPDAFFNPLVNPYGDPKLIYALVPDGMFGMCAHYPPVGNYDRCGYYGGMGNVALLFEISVCEGICAKKELWIQWIFFTDVLDESRVIEAGAGYETMDAGDPVDRAAIINTDGITLSYVDIQELEGEGNNFGKWYQATAKYLIEEDVPVIYAKAYALSSMGLIDKVEINTHCLYDSFPEVEGVIPSDGAVAVSTDTTIQITFSSRMNTLSAENAFSLVSEASTVSGVFAWENSNQKMIFTPAEPLDAEILYTVTLSDMAEDETGAHMEEEYIFSFTTAKSGLLPEDTDFCLYLQNALDELDTAYAKINSFSYRKRLQGRQALRSACKYITKAEIELVKTNIVGPVVDIMGFAMGEMANIKTREELIEFIKSMPQMMPQMIGMLPMLTDPMKEALPVEVILCLSKASAIKARIDSHGIIDQDALNNINFAKQLIAKAMDALCY